MDCSRRLSVEPGFQGARQPSPRSVAQRDRPRRGFESRSNLAMIDELCSSWAESAFFGVAKKAFRDGDGEQQLGAQRVGSGSSARRRHIHAGGWLLRRCLQYPPDRMEPVPKAQFNLFHVGNHPRCPPRLSRSAIIRQDANERQVLHQIPARICKKISGASLK